MPTQIAGISGASPLSPLEIAVDSGGGIHILAAGDDIFYVQSTDGGGTFSVTPITNGQGWSLYQPIMTIGPSGSINILWMSSSNPKFSVSRSTDGGATFSTTTVWNWPNDPTGGSPATSPQLALDANENIYAAWSYCNGSPVTCNNLLFSRSSDQGKTYSTPVILGGGESAAMAVDAGGNLDLALAGSGILFRRSTDHGATFSTPTTVSSNIGSGPPQVAVDSKGDLFVTWRVTPNLFFSRSTDGGATFSSPTQVANEYFNEMMAVDSEDNIDIGLNNVGNDGTEQITFVRSTDGGNTFSSPTQISDDTQQLCPTFSQMALEKSGNIDVIWEEFLSPVGATGTPGCDSLPNQVLFSRGVVPNFTISAAPGAQSVLPGGAANFALTLAATGGFSDAVNLSCTNLPTGAACAFDSSSVTPKDSGSQAELTLTIPPTLAQGSDTFTISAASGSITHTQGVQVAVGGITSLISPTSAVIAAGSSGNFAVTLNSTGSFAGQIMLACSGAPSGMSCSFIPPQPTLTANGSATATLTVQVVSQPSTSTIPHMPGNLPGSLSRNTPLMPIGLGFAAALFIFALPKVLPKKILRARSGWARGFGMMALIVFVAVGLFSCGGATTSSTGSSGAGGASGGTGGTGGATGAGGSGGTGSGGGSGGTGGTGGSTSVTTQFMVQAQSGGATVNTGTISITVP